MEKSRGGGIECMISCNSRQCSNPAYRKCCSIIAYRYYLYELLIHRLTACTRPHTTYVRSLSLSHSIGSSGLSFRNASACLYDLQIGHAVSRCVLTQKGNKFLEIALRLFVPL
jgi:hypothetical protein